MVKKAKTKDDMYVEEMQIWLRQQDNRMANCQHQIDAHKDVIKHSTQEIADSRNAIRLEQQQIQWVRKRKIEAQKDLDAYLREQRKGK